MLLKRAHPYSHEWHAAQYDCHCIAHSHASLSVTHSSHKSPYFTIAFFVYLSPAVAALHLMMNDRPCHVCRLYDRDCNCRYSYHLSGLNEPSSVPMSITQSGNQLSLLDELGMEQLSRSASTSSTELLSDLTASADGVSSDSSMSEDESVVRSSPSVSPSAQSTETQVQPSRGTTVATSQSLSSASVVPPAWPAVLSTSSSSSCSSSASSSSATHTSFGASPPPLSVLPTQCCSAVHLAHSQILLHPPQTIHFREEPLIDDPSLRKKIRTKQRKFGVDVLVQLFGLKFVPRDDHRGSLKMSFKCAWGCAMLSRVQWPKILNHVDGHLKALQPSWWQQNLRRQFALVFEPRRHDVTCDLRQCYSHLIDWAERNMNTILHHALIIPAERATEVAEPPSAVQSIVQQVAEQHRSQTSYTSVGVSFGPGFGHQSAPLVTTSTPLRVQSFNKLDVTLDQPEVPQRLVEIDVDDGGLEGTELLSRVMRAVLPLESEERVQRAKLCLLRIGIKLSWSAIAAPEGTSDRPFSPPTILDQSSEHGRIVFYGRPSPVYALKMSVLREQPVQPILGSPKRRRDEPHDDDEKQDGRSRRSYQQWPASPAYSTGPFTVPPTSGYTGYTGDTGNTGSVSHQLHCAPDDGGQQTASTRFSQWALAQFQAELPTISKSVEQWAEENRCGPLLRWIQLLRRQTTYEQNDGALDQMDDDSTEDDDDVVVSSNVSRQESGTDVASEHKLHQQDDHGSVSLYEASTTIHDNKYMRVEGASVSDSIIVGHLQLPRVAEGDSPIRQSEQRADAVFGVSAEGAATSEEDEGKDELDTEVEVEETTGGVAGESTSFNRPYEGEVETRLQPSALGDGASNDRPNPDVSALSAYPRDSYVSGELQRVITAMASLKLMQATVEASTINSPSQHSQTTRGSTSSQVQSENKISEVDARTFTPGSVDTNVQEHLTGDDEKREQRWQTLMTTHRGGLARNDTAFRIYGQKRVGGVHYTGQDFVIGPNQLYQDEVMYHGIWYEFWWYAEPARKGDPPSWRNDGYISSTSRLLFTSDGKGGVILSKL